MKDAEQFTLADFKQNVNGVNPEDAPQGDQGFPRGLQSQEKADAMLFDIDGSFLYHIDFDNMADAVQRAIYLFNRLPIPNATHIYVPTDDSRITLANVNPETSVINLAIFNRDQTGKRHTLIHDVLQLSHLSIIGALPTKKQASSDREATLYAMGELLLSVVNLCVITNGLPIPEQYAFFCNRMLDSVAEAVAVDAPEQSVKHLDNLGEYLTKFKAWDLNDDPVNLAPSEKVLDALRDTVAEKLMIASEQMAYLISVEPTPPSDDIEEAEVSTPEPVTIPKGDNEKPEEVL
ncbi:hypothetical protein NVP1215B_048 [Vibrio phage 1.215.B._10N.222.54.F7]|nr:hypothetical protein NVP1215A_048 [Vibrio phage 1.215.A._10N.222.54.F7]AUR96071.1 hypothetical protein NVP1215B_048 [Vibrio phage 1.215.B._10N.222.54.F7]